MTPESKIKRKIRLILDTYKPYGVYYYMPVPGGFGRSSLDYLGFLLGYGFAIEAKREGGKPTERQEGVIEQIRASGTPVFVIDGVEGLTAFNDWAQSVVNEAANDESTVISERAA